MRTRLVTINQSSMSRDQAEATVDRYLDLQADEAPEARKRHYDTLVDNFYDLVTDFYEFGWGSSFHFAPRFVGESFDASLARHEYYLASALGLRQGMKVLDVGCGVGGPMRAIARFSGADITGITINEYQVKRGTAHNEKAGLANQCRLQRADFLDIPFDEGSFARAFAIESTCHAPDKVDVFREVFRVLEPGGAFVGYEWCLTGAYDAANPEHQRIKRGIEEGNGLPELAYCKEVLDALKQAGFELVSSHDKALEADVSTPWYQPLTGKGTLSMASLRSSTPGRWVTDKLVGVLETVKLAPPGTGKVSRMLNKTADALVRGGELGIFTPMFFFHVRKP